MYKENKSRPNSNSVNQASVDLIWDLLDLDLVLTGLVTQQTGINAVAVQSKLIPPTNPDAGHMRIEFAYSISKDLRNIKMKNRMDCAARYMSESCK